MMNNNTAESVVLVVDDEAAIRHLARRILEMGGYRVIEASNGTEALALLDDDTPLDLLIADLHMPGLGGDEMARRIRAARPDLKVLYATAFVDTLFEKRATLWEGEAFLDKPFTANGLLEAVSLLLCGTSKKNSRFIVGTRAARLGTALRRLSTDHVRSMFSELRSA